MFLNTLSEIRGYPDPVVGYRTGYSEAFDAALASARSPFDGVCVGASDVVVARVCEGNGDDEDYRPSPSPTYAPTFAHGVVVAEARVTLVGRTVGGVLGALLVCVLVAVLGLLASRYRERRRLRRIAEQTASAADFSPMGPDETWVQMT